MPTAYLFEVQSIQSYIFASGKLRDASGASELVNSLCGEAGVETPEAKGLAERLRLVILPDSTVFRSTGGVLDLVDPGDIKAVERFRALFRLLVARQAPGLAFADGIGTAEDLLGARAAARADARRSTPVPGWSTPSGSPLVRPAPLTGGSPAIVRGWTAADTGACVITGDFADLPTLARRQKLARGSRAMADQFLPSGSPVLSWPVTFRDDRPENAEGVRLGEVPVVFPFGDTEVPRIGLIHADGNGIGRMFMQATQGSGANPGLDASSVRLLSFRLAAATREAAQEAMSPVLKACENGVIPARPILLGGDDISIILRADMAMAFVQRFVEAFERRVTAAVRTLLPDHPVLTAKVGVVVLGPNQPFARAYEFCEALASGAKTEGVSSVGFCRITTSAFPVGPQDLERQGKAVAGASLWRRAHSTKDLNGLMELAALLRDDAVGHGALRRVPELMKTDHAAAESVYRRALDMVGRRDTKVHKRLIEALAAFGMTERSLPRSGYCPLLDAHDLGQFGAVVAPEGAA